MEQRVTILERRVRRLGRLCVGLTVALASLLSLSATAREELTVARLAIVDAQGRERIVLGTDSPGTGRIAEATGIVLLDANGAERGGFSTLADGSVVLGLDAPLGVGSPMRDRVALKVYPNGAAAVSVIGNDTGIPVQLTSDADGNGWLQFLDYDLDRRMALIKQIGYEGETRLEQSLDSK